MNNQIGQLSFDLPGTIDEKNSIADKNKYVESVISAAKAMKMLDLSRHSFEKLVQREILIPIISNGKKNYSVQSIKSFMTTKEYSDLVNGTVDIRNSLNDLTGKDWLPETKSFFYQKGLGANHPEAQIEKLHPAPYSFQDIIHLVKFFTKGPEASPAPRPGCPELPW